MQTKYRQINTTHIVFVLDNQKKHKPKLTKNTKEAPITYTSVCCTHRVDGPRYSGQVSGMHYVNGKY